VSAVRSGGEGLWIVVPLFNQWPMTEAFHESLLAAEPRRAYRLLAVDNGSTDGTAAGLRRWSKRLPLRVLRNRANRGVAPAWNQGLAAALKGGARWIAVLNNDLLLGPATLTRMAADAQRAGWQAVCPATREGSLDYDFSVYAAAYTRRCAAWRREGRWFGWCFMVSGEAARRLGPFDEGFKLGIGEDEDYFRRLQAAGLRYGVTGGAFVHHFGSATLGPLRRRLGKGFEEENLRKLRARWGGKARPRWSRLALSLGRAWDRLRWGHALKE
jgi:GT2 family glycosyltransferase